MELDIALEWPGRNWDLRGLSCPSATEEIVVLLFAKVLSGARTTLISCGKLSLSGFGLIVIISMDTFTRHSIRQGNTLVDEAFVHLLTSLVSIFATSPLNFSMGARYRYVV